MRILHSRYGPVCRVVLTFEALQSCWRYEEHLIPRHSLNTKDLALTPALENVLFFLPAFYTHHVMRKAHFMGKVELSQCTSRHLRRAAKAVGMQTGPDTSICANRKVANDAEVHPVVLGLEATQGHTHVYVPQQDDKLCRQRPLTPYQCHCSTPVHFTALQGLL